MDQLLVDPNSIAKDQGYTDFKIKMIFADISQSEKAKAKTQQNDQALTEKTAKLAVQDEDDSA